MSSSPAPAQDSPAEEDRSPPHEQSALDDDAQESEDLSTLSSQIGRQATRQNIKVICRIRPTNEKELANEGVEIVTNTEDSIDVKSEDYDHHFNFDHVFGKHTTQVEMFEKCAKPLITDVFAGYNATIFAYGQTGTGKTHTMEGNIEDEEQKGIIPRSIEALFEFIAAADDTIEFTLKVSYIEIYMERIRDLLDHTRTKVNLTIREHKNTGVFIADVTEEYVTSVRGILRLMQIGAKNRSVAATGMNEGSSRSHSVFTVTVSQKNIHTAEVKTGKLVLVDLAGSEMVKKTNSTGQQLEEAKTINKSLSALGLVINALTDEKATHIPYRDSKLTRLLQDSLGGNAKTVSIIAVSPSSYNAMETVSTLRFGTRAKSIENKVEVNRTRTVEMLEALLEKAELAIDKQSAIIATLKARLEAAIVSSSPSSQNAPSQQPEELAAMDQLQEIVDRLGTELAEEREYAMRLYKKLEEVKAISDGRRSLIEDATTMLEAMQKAKLLLEEQVASLKTDKATLSAELEQVRVISAQDIAKLRYEIREKETHIEALNHELQVLGEENAGLKDKLLSTPRVRSMNFAAANLSPSSASAVLFSTGSFIETATGSANANITDGNTQTAALSQASPDQAENARIPPTNASDKVAAKVENAEVNEAREECDVDEIAVQCDSFLSPEDYDKQQSLSSDDELHSMLRSQLDALTATTVELNSKCERLEIEKQELQRRIEQRDERISDLENSNAELNSQMFEKTKSHCEEVEDLRSMIQALRLEHEQEIEELKRSRGTTPLKLGETDLATPRTIRGGVLSPASVLSRSLANIEEEERGKVTERHRSMDLMRQESHPTDFSPASKAFFPPTPTGAAQRGLTPRVSSVSRAAALSESYDTTVVEPEILLSPTPTKSSREKTGSSSSGAAINDNNNESAASNAPSSVVPTQETNPPPTGTAKVGDNVSTASTSAPAAAAAPANNTTSANTPANTPANTQPTKESPSASSQPAPAANGCCVIS